MLWKTQHRDYRTYNHNLLLLVEWLHLRVELLHDMDDQLLLQASSMSLNSRLPFPGSMALLPDQIYLAQALDVDDQGLEEERAFLEQLEDSPDEESETLLAAVSIERSRCDVCTKPHFLKECQQFLAMEPEERGKIIIENRRCTRCFNQGHMRASCKSKIKCQICGKDTHHTLLHGIQAGFAARNFQTQAQMPSSPARTAPWSQNRTPTNTSAPLSTRSYGARSTFRGVTKGNSNSQVAPSRPRPSFDANSQFAKQQNRVFVALEDDTAGDQPVVEDPYQL